jgi:hypothetical protein
MRDPLPATPRYPHIRITPAASRLELLGQVIRALNAEEEADADEYLNEVNRRPPTYGDVLHVTRQWVTVARPGR